MAIHFSGQTIFSFTHTEGIMLGTGEEVDEVVGGACGMGVNGIGEVVDRASKGQAAGVYKTGLTEGFLARLEVKDGIWGLGIKVSSNKELTKIRGMVEDN